MTPQITTTENGPLLVDGPVQLNDFDGTRIQIPAGAVTALCRCGQSNNKPFSATAATGRATSTARSTRRTESPERAESEGDEHPTDERPRKPLGATIPHRCPDLGRLAPAIARRARTARS